MPDSKRIGRRCRAIDLPMLSSVSFRDELLAPASFHASRSLSASQASLEISPRRRCRRLCLEVPWNQNFEGVEARVDQEVEDRQLRQLRLLRFHGRDPFAMRRANRSSTRHSSATASLSDAAWSSSARRGECGFRTSPEYLTARINASGASRATRVTNPSAATGSWPRYRARASDIASASHDVGRAVLHHVAGPEQAVALLLRELLLADGQRLSVQVGAGDSLDDEPAAGHRHRSSERRGRRSSS